MPKQAKIPSYCLHKPSGRAYVRIHGEFMYLGDYGTPESQAEYARIIAELAVTPTAVPSQTTSNGLLIKELIDAYWLYAEGYYQKNGKPSHHLDAIKIAVKRLRKLYGETSASDFSPRSLKAFREVVIQLGCCRRYVNKQVDLIRLMFKWGVAEELIPIAIYQTLSTVTGLRKGRSSAKDNNLIGPVDDAVVKATLPYLPAVVADMVRLQRLTGCRPGEICQIRPVDLNRNGEIWEYRPSSHKTEHHDKQRVIYIGPQAQKVLRPYLLRAPDAFCFSPIESTQIRLEEKRAKRKTKVQPSQLKRRKHRPKRQPGTSYERHAYGNAIRQGVRKANKAILDDAEKMGIDNPVLVPHWHANQLRHSAATEIRRQFSLEAAQVILGHSKADVTQIYAERDSAKAIEVVRQIG